MQTAGIPHLSRTSIHLGRDGEAQHGRKSLESGAECAPHVPKVNSKAVLILEHRSGRRVTAGTRKVRCRDGLKRRGSGQWIKIAPGRGFYYIMFSGAGHRKAKAMSATPKRTKF